MIIPELTDLIVLDEIPEKPSTQKGVMYLLSRPFICTPDFSKEPSEFEIRTTEPIAFVMRWKLKNPIPTNNICAITHPIRITYPDGTKIKIHVIETGSPCGNVMYLFEFIDAQKSDILYTGQFTDPRSALLNPILLNRISNGCIKDLYLDASLANSENVNDLTAACEIINKIINDHPDYQIRLQLESTGYEEVLVKLAIVYNVKIAINTLRKVLMRSFKLYKYFDYDRNTTRIAVNIGPLKSSYQKVFAERKILTIRIIASEIGNVDYNGLIADGLVTIPYADHPSINDLHLLITMVKPRNLHAISTPYVLNETIPDQLRDLCANYVDDNIIYSEEVSSSNRSFLAISSSSNTPTPVSSVSDDCLQDASEIPDSLFEKQASQPTNHNDEQEENNNSELVRTDNDGGEASNVQTFCTDIGEEVEVNESVFYSEMFVDVADEIEIYSEQIISASQTSETEIVVKNCETQEKTVGKIDDRGRDEHMYSENVINIIFTEANCSKNNNNNNSHSEENVTQRNEKTEQSIESRENENNNSKRTNRSNHSSHSCNSSDHNENKENNSDTVKSNEPNADKGEKLPTSGLKKKLSNKKRPLLRIKKNRIMPEKKKVVQYDSDSEATSVHSNNSSDSDLDMMPSY